MAFRRAPMLLCIVALLLSCTCGLSEEVTSRNVRSHTRVLRSTTSNHSIQTSRFLNKLAKSRRALQEAPRLLPSPVSVSFAVDLNGQDSPAFECDSVFADAFQSQQLSNAISSALISVLNLGPDNLKLAMVSSSSCSKVSVPGRNQQAVLRILADVSLVLSSASLEAQMNAALSAPESMEALGTAVEVFWNKWVRDAPASSHKAWIPATESMDSQPGVIASMPLAPPPMAPSSLPVMPLAPPPQRPSATGPYPPSPSDTTPASYPARPPAYHEPLSYGPPPVYGHYSAQPPVYGQPPVYA
ncbi:hypothetical protein Agub_g6494 [Astrephomene gubernaculifera]|uniref:Uncharacterized protein n=1 Tax=Astrephomene gubernaculifera TaxID=47775 RepID=A0AAD3DNG5_9CHLO|nr:hypothetical protein Agub_g6494 [Astrephomene gubernaculifera]